MFYETHTEQEKSEEIPMLRLCFILLLSVPYIVFYVGKGIYIEHHPSQYTEEDRYEMAQNCIHILKRNGLISTKAYGTEHLPKEGGYVMFANHQGKYDALGIMYSHKKPCTVVIDAKRSHLPIADQFITLLKGTRLDKSSAKSQVRGILNVVTEVTNGRRYIIFPEGGYSHNRNTVCDFMPGAFKCAMKSKSPIVPVALIDSYKPFELNSLRPVKTQVHFLPPIYYEDYKELSSKELASITRQRIIEVIERQCNKTG